MKKLLIVFMISVSSSVTFSYSQSTSTFLGEWDFTIAMFIKTNSDKPNLYLSVEEYSPGPMRWNFYEDGTLTMSLSSSLPHNHYKKTWVLDSVNNRLVVESESVMQIWYFLVFDQDSMILVNGDIESDRIILSRLVRVK